MTASGDDGRDHGTYLPATDDWPSGLGEASWWPLVTALGVVGVFVGAAVYVVGRSAVTISNPRVGVAVAVAGVVALVGGATGWTYHGFVTRYWNTNADRNRNRYFWGVLLFVAAELATFGAVTLYFVFLYLQTWPPRELPPVLTTVTWLQTAALLVSSLTIYFAGRALRAGNRRRFLVLLAATPALGLVFLVGKAWNYYRLVVGEGVSFGSGGYWDAFFGLGGLHALLTVGGVAMLLVVLARALAGQYSTDRHVSLTTAARYWWVVDTLWIVLFTILYTSLKIPA